jgi:hypothetical protein
MAEDPEELAPVPERLTLCVAPVLLTDRVAVREPVATGVNATVIVQLCAAARVAGQLLVCEKSRGLVPAMLIPLTASDPLPLFENVTA